MQRIVECIRCGTEVGFIDDHDYFQGEFFLDSTGEHICESCRYDLPHCANCDDTIGEDDALEPSFVLSWDKDGNPVTEEVQICQNCYDKVHQVLAQGSDEEITVYLVTRCRK